MVGFWQFLEFTWRNSCHYFRWFCSKATLYLSLSSNLFFWCLWLCYFYLFRSWYYFLIPRYLLTLSSFEYASYGCHHLMKFLFSDFQLILDLFLFLETQKIFSLLLLIQNFTSQISKCLQDRRIPSHLKDLFDCYLHYIQHLIY